MLPGHTQFLALLLFLCAWTIQASGQKSETCKLASRLPSPKVTPWDSKSIKVSWDNVFQNCLKEDVKALQVKIETQMNAVIEHKEKDVEFEGNEAILERSPCLTHTVYLVLHFTDSKKAPLESSKTGYNKASGPAKGPAMRPSFTSHDLYSGWLTTKVVRNICLNKNRKTVTIPHIPKALKDCIKTEGVVEFDRKIDIGEYVVLEIKVEDPRGTAHRVQVKPQVKKIQACTECTMNNSVAPMTNAHNSSHIIVSWENIFQGCENYEIKELVTVVGEQRTKRKFGEKNALIPESPCLNHSVRVQLNFRDSRKESLNSETIVYPAKGKEYCTGVSNDGLLLGLAVGIPIVITLFCCFAALLLFWRSKKTKEKFEDEDANPVYGIYASDEVDMTEVTDSNEVYGGEEEEGRGENEDQIMDNNPTYE